MSIKAHKCDLLWLKVFLDRQLWIFNPWISLDLKFWWLKHQSNSWTSWFLSLSTAEWSRKLKWFDLFPYQRISWKKLFRLQSNFLFNRSQLDYGTQHVKRVANQWWILEWFNLNLLLCREWLNYQLLYAFSSLQAVGILTQFKTSFNEAVGGLRMRLRVIPDDVLQHLIDINLLSIASCSTSVFHSLMRNYWRLNALNSIRHEIRQAVTESFST